MGASTNRGPQNRPQYTNGPYCRNSQQCTLILGDLQILVGSECGYLQPAAHYGTPESHSISQAARSTASEKWALANWGRALPQGVSTCTITIYPKGTIHTIITGIMIPPSFRSLWTPGMPGQTPSGGHLVLPRASAQRPWVAHLPPSIDPQGSPFSKLI